MAKEDEQRTAIFFRKNSKELESAIALVGGTVGRAKALFKPENVPCEDKQDALKNEKRSLDPYKIALVPQPIVVKELGKSKYHPLGSSHPPDGAFVLHERQFDHFDLCVNDGGSVTAIEVWCDTVVKNCETALLDEADFVVMPELSFPNFWPGRDNDEFDLTDRRRNLTVLRSFLDTRLQNLATEHNSVIICGSYHDWESFENICPIYFPDRKKSRNHKKRTTATKVGEHIKVAHGVRYPVYHAIGRAFCVLICTDAFDLNMFFRQAIAAGTSNYLPTKPEIYFVPSFFVQEDSEHALRDACRQLSLATGRVVVFVNHSYDEQGCAVFAAGDSITLDNVGVFSTCELSVTEVNRRSEKTDGMRKALNHILNSTRHIY